MRLRFVFPGKAETTEFPPENRLRIGLPWKAKTTEFPPEVMDCRRDNSTDADLKWIAAGIMAQTRTSEWDSRRDRNLQTRP